MATRSETANDTRSDSGNGSADAPMDRLMEAAEHYLAARTLHFVENAGQHVVNAAEKVAEGNGSGLLSGLDLPKPHLGSMVGHVASAGFSGLKSKLQSGTGGISGAAGQVAETAAKAVGGKSQRSAKKFTHITEVIDVGVPVDVAYDHWTRYEDFSDWSKGVRSVDEKDDDESNWKVKIGPSSRSWQAKVEEETEDERIAWTSDGAKGSTRGVVTFHEIGDRLTRIVVDVEYHPSGPVERVGNLWRVAGRRLRLDLKRFRHHVMFAEDHEGDREDQDDEAGTEEPEDEESAEEEPDEDEDEDEAEAQDEDEDEDEGEDEAEDEAYDEDEEDEDEAEDDEYGEEPEDEDEAYDEDDEYDDEPEDEDEDEEEEEEEPEDDEEDEYEDEDEDEEEAEEEDGDRGSRRSRTTKRR